MATSRDWRNRSQIHKDSKHQNNLKNISPATWIKIYILSSELPWFTYMESIIFDFEQMCANENTVGEGQTQCQRLKNSHSRNLLIKMDLWL